MQYTLKFTEQEMQILNAALFELPFKIVSPLVDSIKAQIVASQNARNDGNKQSPVRSKRA